MNKDFHKVYADVRGVLNLRKFSLDLRMCPDTVYILKYDLDRIRQLFVDSNSLC